MSTVMKTARVNLRGILVAGLIFFCSVTAGSIISEIAVESRNEPEYSNVIEDNFNHFLELSIVYEFIELSDENIKNVGLVIAGIIGFMASCNRMGQSQTIINYAKHIFEGYEEIRAVLFSVRNVSDANKYIQKNENQHFSWAYKHTFFQDGIPLYSQTAATIFVFCGGWIIFSFGSLAAFPLAWVINLFSKSYAESLCNAELGIYYNEPEKLLAYYRRIRAEEESKETHTLMTKVSEKQEQQGYLGSDNSLEQADDIDTPW